MKPIAIAIHGAAGRMGRRLVALGSQDAELKIVAAVDSPECRDLGKDAGHLAGGVELHVPLTGALNVPADAVIDFSIPDGAERIVGICLERKVPLVMATTGLNEAQKSLILEAAKQKFEFPVRWGIDLQSEHERYLAEKHVGKPTIVMNYPKDIKAFYMRMNDDGKTVAAMDVLAPGIGEIVGGSQREERLDMLDRRMDAMHLDKHHYSWYRDLRRYGMVPHAGFGLGFERTIQYATGMQNIRDVIPFPRAPKNADF